MKTLMLVFLLFLVAGAQQTIEIQNRAINTQTNYLLKIVLDSSSLNLAGNLTITFPTKGYTASQLANVACSYTCSVSNLTITIQNSLIPSNLDQISITLSNVINPGSTLSSSQSLTLNISTNTSNQTKLIGLGVFTASTLQSCSLSFNPSTVNTNSNATFSIKTANPVNNGRLLVQLPDYWNYSSTNSSASLVSSSPICNTSSTSTVSCSYINLFSNYLIVNNITTAANTMFSVTVSYVLSPPVSAVNTQLNASTSDSDSNTIDSNVFCTIPALNPKTITINSSVSSVTVSNNFTPEFNFTTPDPIVQGDIVQITASSLLASVGVSSLMFKNQSSSTSLSLIPSSSYQYSVSSTTTASAAANISLSGLSFLSGPFSRTVANAFVITFTRSGYAYITGMVQVVFTPNSLSSLSIVTTPTTVQRNGTYNIEFVTISPLSSDSLIIISFPSGMDVFQCKDGMTINGTVASSGTCQNGTNHNITISGFASSQLVSNTTVNIPFTATNPLSIQPVTFTISTIYNSSNYNPDPLEGITDSGKVNLTATVAVPTCSIVPGSSTLGALTPYNITYTTTSMIPNSGQISIIIPSQLTLVYTSAKLYINNTLNSNATFTITNAQTLSISNLSSANLSSSTNLIIAISNILNPSSYSSTDSFSIASSYNSYTIESKSTDLTVKMNQPAVFYFSNIQPQSQRNGEMNSYNISINSSISIKNGYVLKISMPASVSISNPQCNASSVNCGLDGSTLSYTFSNDYSSNTTILVVVSGFTNPRTQDPTGAFNFSLYSGSDLFQTETFAGFSNTLPNFIQSFTNTLVDPSQSYLNSVQTMRFNVTTKNYVDLSKGQYLSLLIPNSFSNGSLYCQESPYSCVISGKTIKITSISLGASTSFTFTVVNLKTPATYSDMQTNSKNFNISSYSSGNSIIDITNTILQFTLSCDPNCQTCQFTNTTHCLSCYSNSTLASGQCTSCLAGQYMDQSTGLCAACASTCKTCVNNKNTCTSCNSLTFLNTQASTCVTQCPSNTTDVEGICQPCSPSCNECQGSTTSCISCSQGYLKRTVNSSQCVLSCDNGLVQFDGVCQCFQCLTCTGVYTNCTSCNPSSQYHYFYNSSCLNQCPTGTYEGGGTCIACKQGCRSCNSVECLDDLQNSLTSKLIPIPFTLGVIVVVVLAILSKIVCSQTFIPAFIISIGSILQIISWVVIVGILRNFESTAFKINGSILIGVGLGVNYLLNVANIVVFWKYLMGDRSFSFWFRKQSSKINGRTSLILSVLFSHRYIHIFFSKAFHSQSLHGTLEIPRNIVPIYIITGLGFLSQILVIAGCANIAYDPRTYNRTQLFMECIDAIALNIIMVICTSWNFIKPDEFFKPFEISKYKDQDQFKNNETIEDMNDKYLENLELEEVVGSVGGRAKYSNTRLHLQGLDEKVLQKNKHMVVSNSMTKVVGDDPESLIAHKLITKLADRADRAQLDGISESNEDSEQMSGSRQPLSPQKQHQKPKVSTNVTDYEEKQGKEYKEQIDDGISMSDDSLVRYEVPLEVEEGDIIFAPKQEKVSTSQHPERIVNSSIDQGDNIAKRPRRFNHTSSQNIKFKKVEDEQSSSRIEFSNEFNSSVENHQQGESLNVGEEYDQDEVPELPAFVSKQIDPENSTNLENVPSQTKYEWKVRSNNPTYTPKNAHGIQSKGFKGMRSLNQTAVEFRKKAQEDQEQLQSEEPPSMPAANDYANHEGKHQDMRRGSELYSSNYNFPHHKFDRYFEEDTNTLFESDSVQFPKIKTATASVGSIKRTNNPALRDQDITREVVARHILAPEVPITIPKVPIGNSIKSVTEPLAVIAEHQSSLDSIRIENPILSQKLKSVEKIYLQKLSVKDSKSRSSKNE